MNNLPHRFALFAALAAAVALSSVACSQTKLVSRNQAAQTIPIGRRKTHALAVSKVRWMIEPGSTIGTIYGGPFKKPVKNVVVDDPTMDEIGKKIVEEAEDWLLKKGYVLAGKKPPTLTEIALGKKRSMLFRGEIPKEPVLLLEIELSAVQISKFGIVAGDKAEANISAVFRLIEPETDGVVFEQATTGSALITRSSPAEVGAEAVVIALSNVLGNAEFVRKMTEPRKLHQARLRNVKKVVFSDVDRPTYKAPLNKNNYALVIGIEKYKKLPPADYAERDAVSMKKHLKAMGYPERNIIELLGEDATLSQMHAYLEEWLPKNVKKDSTVFFYFSGHGAPSPETKQAYLVPYNANAKFLKTTAYPVKKIYAALNKLPAKRVIVTLDACFSGAGGRSVLAKGTRPLVTKVDMGVAKKGKLALLTASASDEITGAFDEQGHGVFTYYLLQGINKAAKDSMGSITLQGLYKYLKPKVQKEAKRQNRLQTPTLSGQSRNVVLMSTE